MNSRNDLLTKIKEDLKSLFKSAKFTDIDLADGGKITSPDEVLAVGSEVFGMDADGNQVPVEDGSYVLSDGSTIEVASGVITAMANAEIEDAETPAEDASATMAKEAPVKDKPKEGGDLEARVVDLESQLLDVLAVLDTLNQTQKEANSEMMSKISSIGKEPGEPSIKVGKKGKADYSAVTSNDSLIEDLRDRVKMYSKRN